MWLIHHDPEARQHKIYAMLLVAMGVLEYSRAKSELTLFWQRWTFPALAVFGAIFLLFHAHGGGSGLPPGWDEAEKNTRIAKMREKAGLPPLQAQQPHQIEAMGRHSMNMAYHGEMHNDVGGMSGMTAPSPDASKQTAESSGEHKGHVMTAAMMHIQKQHLWYAIVGLSVAMLKFLSDGKFWKWRWLPFGWPMAMAILGVLLTRYTE